MWSLFHLAKQGLNYTDTFPDASLYPGLIDGFPRIDLGLIFALVAVAAVWFALYRTSWGLKLRLVGHNARFAEYSGIKATFIMVSAMTVSGALGGLLGAMFVQGQAFQKLQVLFEGNLAFEGILVAIVARAPAAGGAVRGAGLRLPAAGRAADEHAHRRAVRGDRHRHRDHHPARRVVVLGAGQAVLRAAVRGRGGCAADQPVGSAQK